MSPTAWRNSIWFAPSRSISRASLLAKWIIDRTSCVGQLSPLSQRIMTSSGMIWIRELHDGQLVGTEIIFSKPLRFDKFSSFTLGITSPALCNKTVSPILISNLFIYAKLWKVARATVTPPIFIGSNSATGVSTPVLPT